MSGSITGDLSALGRLADNLRSLSEVPSQASRDAADGISEAIENEFDAGADPYGELWEPLRPATIAKGRFPPPLTDTEYMRDTTEVKPLPGAGVAVTFDAPYAVFHQGGTKRMVARKILPEGPLPVTWEKAIDDAVQAAVDRRLAR